MNILTFDTSGDVLSVSVKTDREFYEENISAGLRHSEHLLPSAKRLMKLAGLSFDQLQLIVCSKGPGSFTGLRIGMSTAKGISTGSNTPVVSVNTLDAYAWDNSYFDGAVVPLLDARKKRFYAAVYKNNKRISDFLDISSEELIEKLSEETAVLFCGTGCNLFHEQLSEKGLNPDFKAYYSPPLTGISSVMAVIGEKIFNSEGPDADDSGPLYIRLSDAELSKR